MKTKNELQKAITETQHKYKVIDFGNNSKICKVCLSEL